MSACDGSQKKRVIDTSVNNSQKGGRCWHCNRYDLDVASYAQSEKPKKHYLSLHPACVREMGVGGELVPIESGDL